MPKFRGCPFCGGEAEIYFTQNRNSAFIACKACGSRTRIVSKGASGEAGIIEELAEVWNHNIFDKPMESLKLANRMLERDAEFQMILALPESEIMKECYEKQWLNVEE